MAQINPIVPGTYNPISGASAMLSQPATLSPTMVGGTYNRPTMIPTRNFPMPSATGGRGSGGESAPFGIGPYIPYNYGDVTAPEETSNEFVRGVNRGIQQLQATAYGAAGLAGDVVAQGYNASRYGDANNFTENTPTALRDWGYEGYSRNMEEAAEYYKTVERIENIDSLGSAATWLAGTAGELVPNIAAMLVPGGVAAVAGRTIGAGAVKKAATTAVERLVAQGMTTEAALAQVNANIVRKLALAATGSTSSLIESGSNWGQSVEARGTNTNPLVDLGFGIASGMTDVLIGAEGSVLKSVLGRPVTEAAEQAVRRGIVTGVLATAGQEGFQEGLQEILSITNQNLQDHDISLTEDDVSDILNAMAAGFVGGAVMSPATIYDVKRHNRNVDRLNAAANTTVGNSPTPTTALVDKAAIVSEQQAALQPYEQARLQRQEMLTQQAQEIDTDIAYINEDYQGRIDQELAKLSKIDERIAQIEDQSNPDNPFNARDPREREKELRRLKIQEKAKVNARVARLQQNRDEYIQSKYKEFGDYDARTQTLVRKSKEAQWLLDSQRRAQTFSNDPTVIEALDSITDDVAIFANRQADILDTRIRKIRDSIEQTQASLEEATLASQTDSNAPPVPESAYRYMKKRVAQLRAQLRQAQRRKEQIRKLAKGIISDSVRATDDTLGRLGMQVQELYSLSDSVFSSPGNKDLFADGTLLAGEENRTRLKELANNLRTVREQINNVNTVNDPVATTAASLVRQAELQAQAESQAPINIPAGYNSLSDFVEAQQRARQEARNVEATDRKLVELEEVVDQDRAEVEQTLLAEQQAEQQQQYQEEVAQASQQAAYNQLFNVEGGTPEIQQALYNRNRQQYLEEAFNQPDEMRQLAARLGNIEQALIAQQAQLHTQESIQEATPGQEVEAVNAVLETKEEQALRERPAAQEASNLQIQNGSTLVENTRQTRQGKEVARWLRNALRSLPVLRENTVFAVDGMDISVPVELQNKIYDTLAQTGEHPVGAYYNGKVYLFTSRINGKEQAIRALVHEGIGHFGLRCIMTPTELNQFLKLVYDSFSNTDAWSNFVSRNSEQFQSMDRFRQAEEFVAYYAQGQQPARYLRRDAETVFRRIKNFIRNLLTKIGFTRITEADIQDVLSASAHFLANSDIANAYVSENVQVLLPNGIEQNTPPMSSTGNSWGVYFGSIEEARLYNEKVSQNVSGVPGDMYSLFVPSESNTLMLDTPLSDQAPFIVEMLPELIDSDAISIEQITEGAVAGYRATLLGQDVGTFPSEQAAQQFLDSDNALASVTGQNLYDYITTALGTQKDASTYLSSMGILGATMTHLQRPTYVLFNGNDLATVPQNPSIPYETPMFMQESVGDTLISNDRGVVALPEETPVKNDTMLSLLSDHYKDQNDWIRKVRNTKRTGVSYNPTTGRMEYGKFERFIEFIADRHRPVKLIQQFLEETIPNAKRVVGEGLINYRTNIYKMLTGLNNRIHARQIELHDQYVNPLIAKVQELVLPQSLLDEYGLGKLRKGSSEYVEAVYAVLGDYMWARHAPERNRIVNNRFASRTWMETDENGNRVRRARRDPDNSSDLINASGLSDTDAAFMFEQLDAIPGLREAADLVDDINTARIDLLEEYKLINESTANKLRETYQFYVPLANWTEFMDDIAPGYYNTHTTSSGISVGGRTMAQYAKGRSGVPNNPVVQSILQMYDVAAVGTKNNVSRGLLELVRSAPDDALWEVSGKEDGLFRTVRGKDGEITLRQKSHKNEGEGFKQVLVVDDDGKIVRISIKDDVLAMSLRGENLAPAGPVINFIRTWTSRMSQLMTSLNPAFIASNPIRDLETAILNMGNIISENESRGLFEKSEQIKKNIAKDAVNKTQFKLLKNIIQGKRDAAMQLDPQMYQEYLDFSANGGHTRMFDLGNFESNYQALIKETKKDTAGIAAVKKAVSLVDDMSNVTENIVRFSVYRNIQKAFETNIREQGRAEGWSAAEINRQIELAKQKSANVALESTVNFTRKGSGASIFNGLYAFSSATIQGSVRIMQNLWRKNDTPAGNFKRLSKYIARGAAGAYLQGMLCRMWMDDDDDGINKYDKIPSFEKYRSIIIPNPLGNGGYVKIPLAYGYNIFWVLGVAIDDIVHGNRKAPSALADIFKESLGAFSPIDPIDEGFTAFVPTLFRPVAQIATNTTFSGTPIYPENTGKTIPDSQKFWAKTPEGYKMIARWLNDPYVPFVGAPDTSQSKFIDVSPESLEHIVTSYLGGVGRVLTDTLGMLSIPAGKEVEVSRLPILNRFYGEVSYSNTAALYNRVVGQVEQSRNAMKIIRDDPNMTPQQANVIRQEYQQAFSLDRAYAQAQQQLSAIRRQERDVASKYSFGTLNPEYNRRMQELQNRKEKIMQNVLRSANRVGIAAQEGN